MKRNQHHVQAGQNLFMSSITAFANLFAFVAAFLGGPTLYQYTGPIILEFTYQTYGGEIIGIAKLVWFGVCYLVIFFGARATIGTAMIFGGVAIVSRLM